MAKQTKATIELPAVDPLPQRATIEAPLGEVGDGYLTTHVEARLKTLSQRQAMRALIVGLADAGERTEDGRPVQSTADAIRWVLERLAAVL